MMLFNSRKNKELMTTEVANVHYMTRMSGGKHWSLRLRRGLTLTLTDIAGGANVGLVMYNAMNLLERYNAPDTLKSQHTFHLTQGHCLYSDMGRVMASITHDTAGGHETVCGNSSATQVSDYFGSRTYQNDRNEWHQNGQDSFLIELSKYGLGRSDLPANINLFNKCVIDNDGGISLNEANLIPGRSVTLRIELDCLILLHTCPHPLLASGSYPKSEVSLEIADAPEITEDDECFNSCDENKRGFENNRIYHLGY